MSIHVLDKEDSEAINKIFESLQTDTVHKKLRQAIDAVADTVCDNVLDYMKGEYALRFEEVALKKARKIVEALLRGESLESFGLRVQEMWNKSGEFYAYDSEKIRASIVRDFKADIQTAEILELQKEVERLQKDVDYYRRRVG